MWPNCTSLFFGGGGVNLTQRQLTGFVKVACCSSRLVLMSLSGGSQSTVFY